MRIIKILLIIALIVVLLTAAAVSALIIFPKPVCSFVISKVLKIECSIADVKTDYRARTLSISGIKIKTPDLSIGSLTVNFKTNKIGVANLNLKNKNETVLDAPSIDIKIPDIKTFITQPMIEEIALVMPKINIVRYKDNSFNFSEFIKEDKNKQSAPLLLAKKLTIYEGYVKFTDEYIKEPAVTSQVKNINANIELDKPLSKDLRIDIKGNCSLGINSFCSMNMTGGIQPLREPVIVDAKVKLSRLELTQFRPYYEYKSPIIIERGFADIETDFHFREGAYDAYYIATTYDLAIYGKGPGGDVFGIPINELKAVIEDDTGNIMLDFTMEGAPDDISYKPGSITKKALMKVAINILSSTISALRK